MTLSVHPAKQDIDWDDEDEATMVFDRSMEDTARSLLRSAPPPPTPAAGAPPPPPPPIGSLSKTQPLNALPPLSRNTLPPISSRSVAPPQSRGVMFGHPISTPPLTTPIPRAPLPPPPKTGSLAPSSIPPSAEGFGSVRPARPLAGRGMLVGLVVLVLTLAGAITMFSVLRKGSLVVTVSGPGNKAIDTFEVYVDGARKCTVSPCRILGLAPGTHLLKVLAPGYQQTADQAVKIGAGDEEVQNVNLPRASEGTGIHATSEGRGLKLSVDSKDVGPLPQELKDLTPGEHLLRIDGGERYESYEKRVTIEPEQMLSFAPKLKVKKGLATIRLGDNAGDAKVLLVSGAERRPLPALPITVDIQVDKPYSIVATKKGFSDFEERISFEDGQAERTFVVNMTPGISAAAAPVAAAAPAWPVRSAPAPAAAAPAPKPAPLPAGGAKLSINSIPISNVLLDGRPLGQTPKINVNVTPGNHTVVFISAEHGRKTKVVNVEAGRTATAIVRFP